MAGRLVILPKEVPTYPTASDLPDSAFPGAIATLDNGDIYTYDGTTWTLVAYGAGLNSFVTIQVPQGTSPVADTPADTLTLTCADESLNIVGDSTTDTIDFSLNLNYEIDGGTANSVYTNVQFIDGGNANSF